MWESGPEGLWREVIYSFGLGGQVGDGGKNVSEMSKF